MLFRLFGKYCPEGTILFTEGAPGEELYVIQGGAVRLGDARGPGVATTLLGPGDLLGEEAFFGRAPRAARAEAVQDTRLIQVSDRTLEAVVRHGPQTGRQIIDGLLVLAERARGELAAWTGQQLLPRVAPHLLGSAGGAVRPADLAERAGTSETNALLVLEEVARRGLLERAGTEYRVCDAPGLQRFVDGLLAGEDA